MRLAALLSSALALLLATGCSGQDGDGLLAPRTESAAHAVRVDRHILLFPPPTYPVLDNAIVTESTRGWSRMMRSADGATADAMLKDQTPGNVLVYSTIIFNYPEHCVEGEDRLPEPGPCRANGPLDPRDGGIPEVLLSADSWANTLVAGSGTATFRVDLTGDEPTWSSPVNGGPGLVNPLGAVVFVYVMDKGPLAPPGPLREAQTRTLYGGCQGPPAFGPLPCTGVGLAQHLPPEPIGAARRCTRRSHPGPAERAGPG